MNDSRRNKQILLAIVLMGLLLRLGAIVALKSWNRPGAMEHRSIAIGLLKGNGFAFGDFGYYGPSSYQSPPYPLMLAGLFWVFGVDSAGAYASAMLINALFSAGVIWATYLLARALGGSEVVALVAAGLCALWPAQVYAPTHVQAVAFITLCMTLLPVFFANAIRGRDWRPWVAFSAIGCLLALTEPVVLPILVLTGLAMCFWPSFSLRLRARNCLILFGAACFILLPWTIRNRVVHGRWIPVKSAFWMNVWKGNNDNATGTDRPAISEEYASRLRASGLSLSDASMTQKSEDFLRQQHLLSAEQMAQLYKKPESAREIIFKEYTVSWIKANPKRYVELCFSRLWKTLWIDRDNPKSYNLIYIASRSLLLALSAGGAVLALRARWAIGFPMAVFGSCLLLYSLTITAARFSVPFEPFQLCLSALAMVSLWGLVKKSRPAPSSAADDGNKASLNLVDAGNIR